MVGDSLPPSLLSTGLADRDVEAAFAWYEAERQGLGAEFLTELRASYDRVLDGPLKYQELRSGIRRVLVRRFPYAVYFTVRRSGVLILAVLHVSRAPAEWQRRM